MALSVCASAANNVELSAFPFEASLLVCVSLEFHGLFVSFDVSKIGNFSFSFQTFFSFEGDFFLNPLIYKVFRMKLFFTR